MRQEQLHAISDLRMMRLKGAKVTYEELVRFHKTEEPTATSLAEIAQQLGVPYEVRERKAQPKKQSSA